jgi:hypothetical protein
VSYRHDRDKWKEFAGKWEWFWFRLGELIECEAAIAQRKERQLEKLRQCA